MRRAGLLLVLALAACSTEPRARVRETPVDETAFQPQAAEQCAAQPWLAWCKPAKAAP